MTEYEKERNQGFDSTARAFVLALGQGKDSLNNIGIMPRPALYELLRKNQILSGATEDSVLASFGRFEGMVRGYKPFNFSLMATSLGLSEQHDAQIVDILTELSKEGKALYIPSQYMLRKQPRRVLPDYFFIQPRAEKEVRDRIKEQVGTK